MRHYNLRMLLPRILSLVLLFLLIQSCDQQEIQQSTFCNPLNLNYRYQLDEPSRREAADPSVIRFNDKYFVFASKSGGYWASDDLVNWKFIKSTDLPIEDYAPAAVVMDDAVYFMALDRRFYKTTNPLDGHWQAVGDSLIVSAEDPDLFLDDDGRLFLYHGLSNVNPIYGVELDTKSLMPIGPMKELFNSNNVLFGWERRGDYNTADVRPYIEGAWMTKHNGKYYLQYAVPGTQFKCYADGTYISDSPLGPFKVAENNPFSYKPEGFIAGAGHGSTFQDEWGNYWHMATMTISVKHKFERRLGLFPAFFDNDGTFYTYTAFGDFPHVVPNKKMANPKDYKVAGMLLSFRKPVEVSSSEAEHPKEYAVNENVREYWSAASGKKGEWITVDLENECQISSVQINFADEGTNILGRPDSLIYYQYLLEYSKDKNKWETLANKSNNKTECPHDYIELENKISARYVRLTNYHVPAGKFAISGLRIFGKGNGELPKAVTSFSVVRDTEDPCIATLKWEKGKGAIGYNIRYGTQPEKLYLNYQVFDTDSLILRSLSRLQQYYFAVDAFNENGIREGNSLKAINIIE